MATVKKLVNFKERARYITIVILCGVTLVSWINLQKNKPVIYLIGDSTVADGSGWGKYLSDYFDQSKVRIKNYAIPGTSSRTFYTSGVWDKALLKKGAWDTVLLHLNPGDYVIMQFGHNDNASLDDTLRARGTLKGIGNDVKEISNFITGKYETVHSYGWYIREFIKETKERGAIPIVCSPIPKNLWKDGKIVRDNDEYSRWAKQVAFEESTQFIDLNQIVANAYDSLGEEKVRSFFHVKDNIHPLKNGNVLNAQSLIKGVSFLDKCKLKSWFNKKAHDVTL